MPSPSPCALIAEAPAMLEALRELVEIVEGFDIQREEDEAPLPSVIRARAILARIDEVSQ